jgi:PPOX class probable F420-dependent enzyme
VTLFAPWERALLEAQRVAHLATVGEGGAPAVVPVVYAVDGDDLVTPLDGKPKRTALTELRRVRDIQANPQVALVVDHYAEDWTQLAWVQARGTAAIVDKGDAYERGIALLAARYPQYATVPLAGRPLIRVTVTEVRRWRAREHAPPAEDWHGRDP